MLAPVTLAHAGHWAVNLLYVAPVIVTGLALLVVSRVGPRGETDQDDRR